MIRSIKTIISALIVAVILSISNAVAAETYFVRTDGNNTNNGLSNSGGGAWKTLKYAFSKLQAGDSLLVADGDYNELDLIINFTGGSKSVRTTIKSINKWGAKIVMDADDMGLPMHSNGIIIDGFEMTWAPNPVREHKGIEIYGNWTTVKNCHVYGIPFSGISRPMARGIFIKHWLKIISFLIMAPPALTSSYPIT